MKTVKRVLITLAVMLGIAAIAFGVNKLIKHKKDVKFEQERIVRTEELGAVTEEKKEEIVQISQLSQEEIKVYIEENAYVEDEEEEPSEDEGPVEDPWADTEFFDYYMSDYADEDLADSVEEAISEETSERNLMLHDTEVALGLPVSESMAEVEQARIEEQTSSEDESPAPEETENASDEPSPEAAESPVPENTPEATAQATESPLPEVTSEAAQSPSPESTSEAAQSPSPETTPETTPGEESEDGSWSAGSKEENVQRVADLGKEAVEGNLGTITAEDEEDKSSENSKRITLKDRQKFRTSEEETQLWIEADNKVLEESESSYEGLKIACLGDSITEATNLDDLEDYEQYSYPSRLKEALGAEEVVNLGIGGSSYGRYWDNAFCERYTEIPEDTDLIIVMGGDNDGFCLTEDLVGSLENREQRTLYGDVDELMRGLKENYPNARVVFMTPMPNLLHDVLRKDREELLSQTVVVNCILELAEEYDFEVIDLYNSNFFDSHDAEIVSDYIPDSVHPNEEGYDIFARHVAAELMRLDEKAANSEEPGSETVSDGEAASEETSKDETLTEEGTETEDGSQTGEEGSDEDTKPAESSEDETESDLSDEEKYDGTTDDHSYTNKIKERIESRLTPEEIEEYEKRKNEEPQSYEEGTEDEDPENTGETGDTEDTPSIKTYARDE